jgi:hypothetical protein
MQAPQTTEQRSRAALVWGVDPVMGKAWLVDLYDASISPPLGIIADALSSNNTQSFQNGNTLYIILRSCMLMPPSRTREARQCMPGEKYGIQLTW